MITKLIIKNNVWIDKLYYMFFPSAFKFLLRAVKLSLFLFCFFLASINIQNNSKILIEPFSVAFSKELTIEEAKIAKTVWKIIGNGWNGTGFFISNNKIVTNAHIIDKVKDLEEITIVQKGNPRRLKVNKIGRLSIRKDLALLEVDGVVSDFIILPEDTFNSSNVYALGYPNGQFKKIRQTGDFKDGYFLSDNSDASGASGSPVLNEAHQLVGVLNQGANNYHGFMGLKKINAFIKEEHFLCAGNVQECFKLLRESFEKNPQEVKRGEDSYNIYNYLKTRGDLLRANWWLEKAAQQGFLMAQNELGTYYYKEKEPTQDTYRAARYWFKKAAQQGFILAQYNLGMMYDKGEGGGTKIHLHLLGMMYDKGEGGTKTQRARVLRSFGEFFRQDTQRARYWFKKAAQQGFAPAQHNLAVMYYKGEGGATDLQLAREWFEKAAQSYLPAQLILERLFKKKENQNTPVLNKCLKIFLERNK